LGLARLPKEQPPGPDAHAHQGRTQQEQGTWIGDDKPSRHRSTRRSQRRQTDESYAYRHERFRRKAPFISSSFRAISVGGTLCAKNSHHNNHLYSQYVGCIAPDSRNEIVYSMSNSRYTSGVLTSFQQLCKIPECVRDFIIGPKLPMSPS